MSTSERRFQAYDIFKLIVTIILIILILWQWRTLPGPSSAASPSPTPPSGATVIAAEPSAVPATDRPTLAVPVVEAVVGAEGVALSGTGTPNSRVQITLDGQVVGQADVDANGRWTFSFDAAPGEHTILVQALEAAGGAAAAASPLTLTVPAPIDAPTLDALPTDAAPGALTLSGTGTPRTTVQIVIDGRVAGQAAIGANGRWSFATEVPTAGAHTLLVNALDDAGQVAASAPPATLQLTAPPTSTPAPAVTPAAPTLDTLPTDGAPGTLALSGSGTPGATIQIVIDGQVAGQTRVGADGRWLFPVEIAAAGEHTVQVNALDNAGQVAASAPPATLQLATASTSTPTPRPPAPTARPGAASDCNPNDPAAYGEDLGQVWRVDRCDTLSYIARRTGIDLNLLIAANPQIQNPDLIFPGQTVTLPGR